MWRQFSLSLGFRFSFIFIFIHFTCYYWLYISNQHKGEEYTLTLSPSGIFFWYISINLILDWYPPRYKLLIAMACYLYTIFTNFEERTKLKMEIWITPSICISGKTQSIVEMNIIIIKIILKCVCLSSSKVRAYESHKSSSGFGQKKFNGISRQYDIASIWGRFQRDQV